MKTQTPNGATNPETSIGQGAEEISPIAMFAMITARLRASRNRCFHHPRGYGRAVDFVCSFGAWPPGCLLRLSMPAAALQFILPKRVRFETRGRRHQARIPHPTSHLTMSGISGISGMSCRLRSVESELPTAMPSTSYLAAEGVRAGANVLHQRPSVPTETICAT